MANLKAIRKRISSVKSTQKITRAMKMVAGARLHRAQNRITQMRPYAVKVGAVLREVVEGSAAGIGPEGEHPLLAQRPEQNVLYVVITSDRGLCGPFNANINKTAQAAWKEAEAAGKNVQLALIGRKGRDHFRRRKGPIFHVFDSVWASVDMEQARAVAKTVLKPFVQGEVDAVYLIYNEFKSAMSQNVVMEPLFPLQKQLETTEEPSEEDVSPEFIFEPDQGALLERLVPMYVEISILRALFESVASELGARMTAMDAATKNASEMIADLTLLYNRQRQAAITTELTEIIGGAEALNA